MFMVLFVEFSTRCLNWINEIEQLSENIFSFRGSSEFSLSDLADDFERDRILGLFLPNYFARLLGWEVWILGGDIKITKLIALSILF